MPPEGTAYQKAYSIYGPIKGHISSTLFPTSDKNKAGLGPTGFRARENKYGSAPLGHASFQMHGGIFPLLWPPLDG